jgi:hypothetical protein
MKSIDCARPPNKRPSSSKISSTVPSRASSSSNAGKRPLNEPTETWEEWKEKSRRLYGTGESSRQKIPQPHTIMPNGTVAPAHPILHASQSLSDIPRFPPAPHWDGPEAFVHQGGPRSSVPILNGHPSSPPHDKPPSWAGGLTGPGSAFLQGPGGPFPPPPPPIPPSHHTPAAGPSSPSSIPQSGRTIYSAGNRNIENAD